MDIAYIKSIRRTIRARIKSTGQWDSRQETLEQTNERVNREHFGGGHVVLRLHGSDRVYHTPKQAGEHDLPSEALADIYGEEAGHEVLGHGSHTGGHVHVDLPEGSYQGSHTVSNFQHLGRNINESYYPPDSGHHSSSNNGHLIIWSFRHPNSKTGVGEYMTGSGNTEREARSRVNTRYHAWHQEQHQQG